MFTPLQPDQSAECKRRGAGSPAGLVPVGAFLREQAVLVHAATLQARYV